MMDSISWNFSDYDINTSSEDDEFEDEFNNKRIRKVYMEREALNEMENDESEDNASKS